MKLPKIHWKNFLTGKDDRTISNVTFLSRPAEWHSSAVGVIAGLTAQEVVIVGLALYVLGRENGKKSFEHKIPENLHIKDAMREPAYALGGIILGIIIHSILWGIPELSFNLIQLL